MKREKKTLFGGETGSAVEKKQSQWAILDIQIPIISIGIRASLTVYVKPNRRKP